MKDLEPGLKQDNDEIDTLIIETINERFIYEASHQGEPGSFWTLSTLIDGMIHRTGWTPVDSTGEVDFTPWAAGIPVWWTAGEVSAVALADKVGVLVLAGSYASPATVDSLNQNYKDQRSAFMADQSFVLEGDRFRLSRHISFSTPSAAASVLLGSNINGRRAWRDRQGFLWSELDLDS